MLSFQLLLTLAVRITLSPKTDAFVDPQGVKIFHEKTKL